MWAAATLSVANSLPEAFHVLNHFSKFNMHLRILSSVLLLEMFECRVKQRAEITEGVAPKQARNQLGTLGGAKVSLKGPQFFLLCPVVLNYVQHNFQGRRKTFLWCFSPLVTGLFLNHYRKSLPSFMTLQDMCGLT